MTHYKSVVTGVCSEEASQGFHNCLIAIPTFTTFFLVKYDCEKLNFYQGIQKGIIFIGSATFGIYLLESILRPRLGFIYTYLVPSIPALPACFIWVLADILVGMLITATLKALPKYI